MDAPKSLYASKELGNAAKLLVALLWTYARPNRPPFVWPKIETLEADLGTDRRRLYRLLKDEIYPCGFARRHEEDGRSGWMLVDPGTGAMAPAPLDGAPAMVPAPGEWHGDHSEDGAGATKEVAPAPLEDSIESKNEAISEASDDGHGGHGTETMAPEPWRGGHGAGATRRRINTFSGPTHISSIDRQERQTTVHRFPKSPEELLGRHGAKIFAELPMFDGKNGRPSRLSALRGKWNAFERELAKSWNEVGAVDALTSWLTIDGQRFRFVWERDGGAVATPRPTTTVYDDDGDDPNQLDPSDYNR